MSSGSTVATTVSRDSSNTDSSSIRAHSVVPSMKSSANNDKNLHGQIEDLLTALSEMQRDHAILATQLQKEREKREEDHRAVRLLLDGLRQKSTAEVSKSTGSEASLETITLSTIDNAESVEADAGNAEFSEAVSKTNEPILRIESDDDLTDEERQDYLSRLLDTVEERFAQRDHRRSSMLQSKSQLRDDLTRAKEQLIFEVSKSQELSRRLSDMEQELQKLKDEVKEGHNHLRTAHQEKQRIEKQVQELRSRKTPSSPVPAASNGEGEWPKRISGNAGLRELRLGRTNSTHSHQATTYSKRTSSLNTQVPTGKENENFSATEVSSTLPVADNDALVLELVQAKTAEAIAKQEAEEAKAKLESLRKLLGMGSGGDSPGHRSSPSQPNLGASAIGAFSSYMGRTNDTKASTPTVTAPSLAPSGGFWTGWGKRAVSSEKVITVQDKT
jgi:hypothetical protein